MDETMEDKFKNYEMVMKSFGKFFDHDGLEDVLSKKASVDQVNQIHRERASNI